MSNLFRLADGRPTLASLASSSLEFVGVGAAILVAATLVLAALGDAEKRGARRRDERHAKIAAAGGPGYLSVVGSMRIGPRQIPTFDGALTGHRHVADRPWPATMDGYAAAREYAKKWLLDPPDPVMLTPGHAASNAFFERTHVEVLYVPDRQPPQRVSLDPQHDQQIPIARYKWVAWDRYKTEQEATSPTLFDRPQ